MEIITNSSVPLKTFIIFTCVFLTFFVGGPLDGLCRWLDVHWLRQTPTKIHYQSHNRYKKNLIKKNVSIRNQTTDLYIVSPSLLPTELLRCHSIKLAATPIKAISCWRSLDPPSLVLKAQKDDENIGGQLFMIDASRQRCHSGEVVFFFFA